ncbi:DNA polymerase III subunit beta [Candidatus Saccharibacteria bacterium]|nr:DNA polymerase III subunit beta [Candidatus Saccharibacteria bacterium]MCB9834572.1 DNA polymerase III subunit beta [Candidatus Nomurabacteria bacterium]
MKISVSQKLLAKALISISRITVGKTTLPILSNILFKANEQGLVLEASNLETSMIYELGCKTEVAGEILVPAKLITDIVSNVKADKLQLVAEGGVLEVVSEGFDSRLNLANPEDFVTISFDNTIKPLKLKSEQLLEGLQKTSFASSVDQNHPSLSSVYLYKKSDQVVLVATDSYRLAEYKIGFEGQIESGLLLPLMSVTELIRIISQSEAKEVQVLSDDKQALFIIDEIRFITRLIEGNFPDYQMIVPTELNNQVSLNRQELIDAIRMADVFSRENSHIITLLFRNGNLTVKSSDTQFGHNSTDLAISYDKEDLNISLNANYLLPSIKAIDSEDILVNVVSQNDPVVINSSPVNPDQLQLIMPLRS